MKTRLALLFLLGLPAPAVAQAPSYSKQVQPFFTRYCVECHNAKEPEGGLVLESYKCLQEGGRRSISSISTWSLPWPTVPTANGWLRAARTAPPGCGTRAQDGLAGPCFRTTALCGPWPSAHAGASL
jgi:hypothetical protein